MQCGIMSAFGGKADSNRGCALRPLMTQSGHSVGEKKTGQAMPRLHLFAKGSISVAEMP
jgi:hypothetical protein